MAIRRMILAGGVSLTLCLVSLPSHAAGAGTYSIGGSLTAVPKSGGIWSLDASVSRLATSTPMMPKDARVEASGILRLAPAPNTSGVGPAVGTGIYTIDWGNGTSSKGVALCEISRVTVCAFRNRSGYLKGAQANIVGTNDSGSGAFRGVFSILHLSPGQ